METFTSYGEGFTVSKNIIFGYLSLFKFEISKFDTCFLHSCLSVKLPTVTRNLIQMKYQKKLEHFEKEKNDLLSICVVWPTTKKKKQNKNKETFYDSWRVEPTTVEVNTLWQ